MTVDPLQHPDRVPPDLTGVVLLAAGVAALVGWLGRSPGAPASNLLLAGMAVTLSVAAWSTTMWLTRNRPPVFRVGAATVASTASVSLLLVARAAKGPLVLMLALVVLARMERPEGHRVWRHAAIAAVGALGVVAALGL